MTYATPADLATRYGLDRLIDLTDRAGTGLADDPMIAQALADAQAEVDGYLAVRYALPLPSVPPLLARLTCDMAIYNLLSLRRMGDVEDARKRFEDARRLAEALAAGRVSLGLPAALPLEQTPQQSLAALKAGAVAQFDAVTFGGF